MMYPFQKTKKLLLDKGFGLLEVMIAIALAGGLSLLVMNIGKQSSDIQRGTMAGNDEAELISLTRTILSKQKNCTESLKTGVLVRTPIKFKKKNFDEPDTEGVEIEIFQLAHDGSLKKLLSGNSVLQESTFGKLKILSIKLVFNNGTGFNYTQDDHHVDTGILRISYDKPQGTGRIAKRTDIILSISMSTDASGETTALNCSKDNPLFVQNEVGLNNGHESGVVNVLDGLIDYTCPGNQVMRGEISIHWNPAEDRVYSFRCADMWVDGQVLTRQHCSWSGQVNDMDELVNYTCPNNTIMTGHFSWHDNGTEDRVYEFKCCDYASANRKIRLEECGMDGSWVNIMDGIVNYQCPLGKVKVGEISVHSNQFEDRMHKFRCCKVVTEEYQ